LKALEVKGLKTYFYTKRGVVKAVDDVSFDLNKGEVLCLVGESGSGKTVSALSILGLIAPPGKVLAGDIIVDGENLRDFPPEQLRKIRGNKIGVIFQNPTESLNPVLKIGDQITEAMKEHLNISENEAQEKAAEILDSVQIPDPKDKLKMYPHELSGGMNQRVMIAMALCCNPEILIADEPTSALDVTTQAKFIELLINLKKDRAVSLIFITHDLGIVAEIADRVVVMYAGKVMEKGRVWDIYENPRHPYTIGLLNCLPDVKLKGEHLTPIDGNIPSLINPPSGCVFHPRCAFAKEICSREIPPLSRAGKDHFSACHFWDSGDVRKASKEAKVAS
jgi:oligopeptide/dipeptide ABC transporter ATP-binding protein